MYKTLAVLDLDTQWSITLFFTRFFVRSGRRGFTGLLRPSPSSYSVFVLSISLIYILKSLCRTIGFIYPIGYKPNKNHDEECKLPVFLYLAEAERQQPCVTLPTVRIPRLGDSTIRHALRCCVFFPGVLGQTTKCTIEPHPQTAIPATQMLALFSHFLAVLGYPRTPLRPYPNWSRDAQGTDCVASVPGRASW